MYSLTEDEYQQLDITTTKVGHKPDQRLVTIEVFHQLHCLVRHPCSLNQLHTQNIFTIVSPLSSLYFPLKTPSISKINHQTPQNYLRRRVYETDGEHFQEESDWSRGVHLSKCSIHTHTDKPPLPQLPSIHLIANDMNNIGHCIDYLRQVLMCHGDLTPITLDLVPHRYQPNFNIKHTCRNFGKIYEFAAKRNISGIGIE
jgi:hypothetical protein